MADLPVYNHRLAVEAIGFQRHGDGWLGIMATPWFMNAVLAPAEPGAWNDIRDGIKVTRALPSGSYEFVAGHIDGIGTILNCSLFSPMFEFEEQEAVDRGRRGRAWEPCSTRKKPPNPQHRRHSALPRRRRKSAGAICCAAASEAEP